jgi:hypothetical protein
MKGEFIVLSYRLMPYDFSNDLLITKGECLTVARCLVAGVVVAASTAAAMTCYGGSGHAVAVAVVGVAVATACCGGDGHGVVVVAEACCGGSGHYCRC